MLSRSFSSRIVCCAAWGLGAWVSSNLAQFRARLVDASHVQGRGSPFGCNTIRLEVDRDPYPEEISFGEACVCQKATRHEERGGGLLNRAPFESIRLHIPPCFTSECPRAPPRRPSCVQREWCAGAKWRVRHRRTYPQSHSHLLRDSRGAHDGSDARHVWRRVGAHRPTPRARTPQLAGHNRGCSAGKLA